MDATWKSITIDFDVETSECNLDTREFNLAEVLEGETQTRQLRPRTISPWRIYGLALVASVLSAFTTWGLTAPNRPVTPSRPAAPAAIARPHAI